MKKPEILFLTTLLPYPLDNGGKIKTFRTLELLKEFADIDLLCFVDDAKDLVHAEGVRPVVRSVECEPKKILLHSDPLKLATTLVASLLTSLPYVLYKFRSRVMRSLVRSKLSSGRYDYVYVDHLASLVNLDRRWLRGAKLILDEHNVESVLVERYGAVSGNPIKKCLAWIECMKISRYEKTACRAADRVLAITPHDADKIRKLFGADLKLDVSPFYVEKPAKTYHGGNSERNSILFLGTMSWQPNKDAVLWFYNEVFKKISERYPRVRFVIVGSRPGPEILSLQKDAAVSVTGYVDEVFPYLEHAFLSVVPLRVASGMRIKILELMAYGMPVVTTTVGYEGIPVEHDRQVLVADDAKGMADAVISLLDDATLRERLSQASLDFIRQKFSREHAIGFFSKMLGAS